MNKFDPEKKKSAREKFLNNHAESSDDSIQVNAQGKHESPRFAVSRAGSVDDSNPKSFHDFQTPAQYMADPANSSMPPRLVSCIVFLFLSLLFSVLQYRNLHLDWTAAHAIVRKLEKVESRRANVLCVTFDYKVGARDYDYSERLAWPKGGLYIGQEVDIRYDPIYPVKAELDHSYSYYDLTVYATIAFLAVAAIFCYFTRNN